MAEWNSNPQWNDLESINGGFNFNSFLDISASDFNKLVENMQYLYKNSGKGEFNMDKIYPKGSIYMTLDPTFNPAEHFGGAWSRLKDRFLLGAGEYSDEHGSEGGTTSHSHSASNMRALFGSDSSSTLKFHFKATEVGSSWTPNKMINVSSSATSDISLRYTGIEVDGNTASVNHMPPYLAVYMWQRTA